MADEVKDTQVLSLWALSTDGTLWQVNTRNGSAAPVIGLDELSPSARKTLQKEMVELWSGTKKQVEEESQTYTVASVAVINRLFALP